MPLNRKMVWPARAIGSGGTTHRVLNDDTGLPVELVQDAYVTHPVPKAGAGRSGWATFSGIRGIP